MWMNGSSSFRSTPAKARLTGNPLPSKADGALVIDTTGRWMTFSGSAGTDGRTVRSGTVTAGTAYSLGRFAFNYPRERPAWSTHSPPSGIQPQVGSITAMESPSLTTSPSLTVISVITPATSAGTGISIFIDSRITSVSL